MRGGKWLAEERGAFDQVIAEREPEPVAVLIVEARVSSFKLSEVMTDDELVMWLHFRDSLRVYE